MKKFLLGLMLVLSVVVITGCGCAKKDDNSGDGSGDGNGNEELPKAIVLPAQETEGLSFSNLTIVYDKGQSEMVTYVTNVSAGVYELKMINVRLLDEDGNEVISVKGYIGSSLAIGEEQDLIITVPSDLRTATKVEYKIEK